ncbi:DNA damage-regulated autophagy modulator protein 1 isoform X1 [Stigmatopora argus]
MILLPASQSFRIKRGRGGMWWFTQGLCFLPFFLVVWSSTSFILSYIIAFFRRDVDLLFPYISDTAANPPESCIFGLMTFVSACAGMATIYSRFKFVEKLSEDTKVVNPRLNKTVMVLGILACVGMCVVATFQVGVFTKSHDGVFVKTPVCLAGDGRDGGSRRRRLAIFRHWSFIHYPADGYVLPTIPTRLARCGVPCATARDRHCLAGLLPHRGLCVFREAERPASSQGKQGLSLPRGQRRVRVGRGFQFCPFLSHVHRGF